MGDDDTVRRYVVAPFPYLVGREQGANLWLPHASISKNHAEFRLQEGQLVLCDLGSTNGTFVNAERLYEATIVAAGDLVHFANIGYRLFAWRHDESAKLGDSDPYRQALAMEIEARRRSEESLWNAEAVCRGLIDSASDGMILVDRAGKIHSVNRAAESLFGYAARELQGRSVTLLLRKQTPDERELRIEDLVAGGKPPAGDRGFELVGRRKDNSMFPMHFRVSEIWLADRRMFAGIVRDVSDEKEAAESLRLAKRAAEEANLAKSEFLANMSHEIRTPMSAILGYADLLLAEEGIERAPPHRIEAFQTIKRNGEHLLQVINDILDLSKVEAGKMSLERIRCSPSELLCDVHRIIKQSAAAKQLPFHVDVIGEMPLTIETDPTRLRQVLVNLVGNAVKFTDTGEVTLAVRLIEPQGGDPRMEFSVADTGIGMTAEQMAKLFRPFTQADASTSRRFGGTGLGLTICKRIIDQLGGEITVESEYAKGTTFRTSVPIGSLAGIPRAKLEWPPAEDRLNKDASPAELDCRILLAEDGPDNQRLLTCVLSKAGADVTLAENGQAAVELVLARKNRRNDPSAAPPFDVILMDMQMPVLDGYQATQQLRAGGCRSPIIALTAHAMQGDREQCLAAGCDDYLAKPIDRYALYEAIRKNLPARVVRD
jgi:PAS domain S-box-containing protein